ncbi:MAG: hypothetical protein Q9178_003993 [Gyalolechia marmorata]
MPRRKVHPPPADAVASSPLFKLSPEVRNMIYTNILVDSDSHHAIFIPTDHFKRRKDETTFQCEICRQCFGNSRQLVHHKSAYGKGEPCKPPTHKLPTISTSLLRSCRLINTEAAPLLYRANAFYFNDPHTLHQFRWKTASYSKLTAWVEEITIELSDTGARCKNSVLWQNYLSGSGPKTNPWRLSDDFPYLKRLTVVLTKHCLLYHPPRLVALCDILGQNLTGLDWVHVIGLNNHDVVPSLKPMVCKTESPQSKEAQDNALLAQLETELNEAMLNHDRLLQSQLKQNTTLVTMAKDQANHKPEDVALQQELADVRLDIVNQRILSQIPPSRPALPAPATQGNQAAQDYQMQLMLLEQQNKRRLWLARTGQVHDQTRVSLLNSRDQHLEVEGRLRVLEVWARHIGRSDPDLTKAISKAEGLVRELQTHVDEGQMRYWIAVARRDDAAANA